MTQHRSRAVRLALLAVPAAGALLLAGCSTGGGGGSSTGGSQSFTLSYAVSDSAVSVPFKVMAEKYMSENPGVTITLNEVPNDAYAQTLTTQLNAGNASDVFQSSPGIGQGSSILSLAQAGLLAPLGDSAAKTIPSGSESQFQADGNTYGVSLGLTFVGAIENTTTADAAGVEYPSTMSDLKTVCSTLASQGRSLYAVAGSAPPNTGLMALVISATRVYADDPTWNEERAAGSTTFAGTKGWQDTLQTIVDLKNDGCFQPGVEGGGFDAITNGLLQGTSLGAFVPGNAAADLKQNAGDQNFAIEPFPPASGGTAFGIAGADYALSLNKAAKNTAAATAYLEWAASDEGQQTYITAAGSLPLGSDLSTTVYAPVADIVDGGNFVPLPNSSWPNASVYDALGSGVQGLLTGQQSVDDVLKAMDTAWDQ